MNIQTFIDTVIAECPFDEEWSLNRRYTNKTYFSFEYAYELCESSIYGTIHHILNRTNLLGKTNSLQIVSILMNLAVAISQESNDFKARYKHSNYVFYDGFVVLLELKRNNLKAVHWDCLHILLSGKHPIWGGRKGPGKYEININKDFSIEKIIGSSLPMETFLNAGKIAISTLL